ncbi:hypothetical protein Q4Q34_14025 [Flavivirga abyssicola]|uniref:hypothetical protein n=1 Tax=Flavivirga abyssicola TaxID=3063533 RepID=UPI0026E04848|nr:hypothetical protein [Flavivirga sp. MEBiC07777]WVK12339.1 hypothetical protein Q4Q34_14025 [Flavivirga sp. MEBiC07777]
MKKLTMMFALLLSTFVMAQSKEEKLPYYEIPNHPESYTAGTVAARMVDGLGFRYYWATEGLRGEDLVYRPSETGRTSAETIDHILGLSNFILSSVSEKGERSKETEGSFEDKRKQTLLNFKKVSDILRTMDDVSQFDNDRFPFWNIINGPIADALWHCGQVVMLRRASGNPFNSEVSVFTGKLRE